MGALAQITRSVDPAIRRHALAEPPAGRFEGLIGDERRALVVEAVHEAFQLHYGEPRAFGQMDSDLRLLAGDSLYALAVERLSAAGDLEAIRELADLISLSARSVSEGRAELIEPLWRASVEALSERVGAGAAALGESVFGS